MERLTLTKEQRIIEEVGYVNYLKPEILTEWDKKLSAYEDTGLEPEEIIDGKMLNGWIPVSEKLPEHLKVVFVTTHDEYIQLAYCKHDGWHLLFNGWLFVNSPLAWMPLPEPYKQN